MIMFIPWRRKRKIEKASFWTMGTSWFLFKGVSSDLANTCVKHMEKWGKGSVNLFAHSSTSLTYFMRSSFIRETWKFGEERARCHSDEIWEFSRFRSSSLHQCEKRHKHTVVSVHVSNNVASMAAFHVNTRTYTRVELLRIIEPSHSCCEVNGQECA